jgi:hypothetical protein
MFTPVFGLDTPAMSFAQRFEYWERFGICWYNGFVKYWDCPQPALVQVISDSLVLSVFRFNVVPPHETTLGELDGYWTGFVSPDAAK